GAAGVIDCDEGGVSDDVERLLAAIVGMCPPADVGEKARHVAQPPLFRGLVEPGGRHEAVGPGDQLLAMGGGARAQHVELARCRATLAVDAVAVSNIGVRWILSS